MNRAPRLRAPEPQGTAPKMLSLGPTVSHRPVRVSKGKDPDLAAQTIGSSPSNQSAHTGITGAGCKGPQPVVQTLRSPPTFNAAEEECLMVSVNHKAGRSKRIVRRSDAFLASLGKSIEESVSELRNVEKQLRKVEKQKEKSKFIFQETLLQNRSRLDISKIGIALTSRRGRATKPSASIRQIVAYFSHDARSSIQSEPEDLLSLLTGEVARLDEEVLIWERIKANRRWK